MQQQLSDGLLLRSLSQGVASDHANLPTFYAETFGEAGEDDTNALREWTRTLISGRHPTTTPDDVWVVVDPAKNDQIVSALLLIPQTWQFGGIPIGVGRVELVATNNEYRKRGLVRALMNVAHERSLQLGHHITAITGIAHYYRRFGYAMAMELGVRNTMPLYAARKLPDGEKPKYTLRPAVVGDAEQLSAWDLYRARTAAVAMVRTPEVWRFEISERHPEEVWQLFPHIIVNEQTGEDVGYILMRAQTEIKFFNILSYVVGEKASYLETFDDVLRGAKAFAEARYQALPKMMPDAIHFDSGVPEVIDQIIQATPGGRSVADTYAWYLRVPDYPAFFQHIAPVLEDRLRGSGANHYTGTLKIEFGDLTGIELVLEYGRLRDVVTRPFEMYEGDVRFPFHTFLNVIFGHRTAEELYHILPESFANAKARVLLNAMFPKQRTWVYALA